MSASNERMCVCVYIYIYSISNANKLKEYLYSAFTELKETLNDFYFFHPPSPVSVTGQVSSQRKLSHYIPVFGTVSIALSSPGLGTVFLEMFSCTCPCLMQLVKFPSCNVRVSP